MIQSIKINLNKTTFTLNNGAYELLNKYVFELKESLKNEPDILFDIEARIAELLTIHLTASGQELVTETHVSETLKTIGSVNDLLKEMGKETADDKRQNTHQTINNTVKNKLYRNPFNQSLGGVCSGIGYYLNIDSSFVRLAFIIATFFFGTSIFIYLLLWILVPKATNERAQALNNFEMNNPNKLYRNSETKAIAGVCSGLALHFGIEIWIVRLVFVIGVFGFGFSVLGYFLCWLVIPLANNDLQKAKLHNNLNYVAQNEGQLNIIQNGFKFVITAIALFLLGILVISFFFTAGMFNLFTNSNVFDFLQITSLFDENLSLMLVGFLLLVFTPILFLLAIIAKYAFKANIQMKYAGSGLVFLFFLGIGILVYLGVSIGPKYFNNLPTNQTQNEDLPQKDSLKFVINEINTGKNVSYFSNNGYKIQLCDSGIFVPIDFEITSTLEGKSNFSIIQSFNKFSGKKSIENNSMVINYTIQNDSIIFPSHYFIAKPNKFNFQKVKVKFYLKEKSIFYANKTAQKSIGLGVKNKNNGWFNIDNLDEYEQLNDELERNAEQKAEEIERKAEEKLEELEEKTKNL